MLQSTRLNLILERFCGHRFSIMVNSPVLYLLITQAIGTRALRMQPYVQAQLNRITEIVQAPLWQRADFWIFLVLGRLILRYLRRLICLSKNARFLKASCKSRRRMAGLSLASSPA